MKLLPVLNRLRREALVLAASFLALTFNGSAQTQNQTGLVGAFVGGILANVLQLDFGLGPVLIRYEDLICSLVGGFVLLYVWGLLKRGSPAKPASAEKKEPAK